MPSAWLASSSSSSASKHVTLSGMSKAYSLPGLRLGWLATKDEQLLGRINELKDYTTICPAAPSSALATMVRESEGVAICISLSCLAVKFVEHSQSPFALFGFPPPCHRR